MSSACPLVVVDGDSTTVRFTGATNSWLQRSVEVNLAAGTNEIRLERFWGYMDIDYLGVEEAAFLGVATEAGADAALAAERRARGQPGHASWTDWPGGPHQQMSIRRSAGALYTGYSRTASERTCAH